MEKFRIDINACWILVCVDQSNTGQRPPGTVPKSARPQSARNLSSTLKKESGALNSSISSSSSNEDNDEFLQNVKFSNDILCQMRSKRNGHAAVDSKSKIDLASIGKPISEDALAKQVYHSFIFFFNRIPGRQKKT